MQRICLSFLIWGLSSPLFGQPPDSVKVSVDGKMFGWEKTSYYQLGNKRIPVKTIEYGNSTAVVLLSVHDDETTSVKAAEAVFEKTGGVLVRISNNNTRLINFTLNRRKYRVDPNRIFTRTGIRQNLRELNGTYQEAAVIAVEKFGFYLLAKIPKNTATLVAVHNNRNEGYSAQSYLRGGAYENDIDDHHIHKSQDKDNFLLTTDKKLFKALKSSGYNLLLQDNKEAKDDGSLSIYYGRKKKSYLNVETELGQLEEQVRMISAVVEALE